jgi:uncharacterized protein YbgA (DUF1722 family)
MKVTEQNSYIHFGSIISRTSTWTSDAIKSLVAELVFWYGIVSSSQSPQNHTTSLVKINGPSKQYLIEKKT